MRDIIAELKESHSHKKCMNCSAKPTKEVLWAEGRGHAWFCDKCYSDWISKGGDGYQDVCGVKAITTGEASKRYADNKNPSLKENVNGEYKLSSTQIYMPNELAEQILKFTLSIAEEDLCIDEGGRELEVHTTIKYGLTTAESKEVETKVKEYTKGVIEGSLDEVTLFENPEKDFDVVKIDVTSDDLNTLHKLFGTLDNKDTYPDYKAHCTIAYVKKGVGKKYVGNQPFTGEKFSVDRFYFCSKEGDKIRINLGGIKESLTSVIEEIKRELTPQEHQDLNVKYGWDSTQTDGDYIRIFVSKVLHGFKVGIQQYVPRFPQDRQGYVVTIQRTNMPIKTSDVLPDMSTARQTAEQYKREVEAKYSGSITEKINKTDADFYGYVYNPQENGKPKSQLMADFYVLNSLPHSAGIGGGDAVIAQHKDTPEEDAYPSQLDKEDSQQFLNANESLLEAISKELAPIVLKAKLNCYNYLKDHMLEAVYFSLCAESRHIIRKSNAQQVAKEAGEVANYTKYAQLSSAISSSDTHSAYTESAKAVKAVWGPNNPKFVNLCFQSFKDPGGNTYPKNFLKSWDKAVASNYEVEYSDNQTPTNEITTTQDIKFEPGNGFYGNLPAGTKGILVKYDYPELKTWSEYYQSLQSGEITQKWGIGESVLNEDEEDAYPPAPDDETDTEDTSEDTPTNEEPEIPVDEVVAFKDITFDVNFGDYGIKTVKGGEIKPSEPSFKIINAPPTGGKSSKTYLDWGGNSSSYGGNPWAKIAEAWMELNDTPYNDVNNLPIKIDHIYDLQHNTGTLFTKVKEYMENGGYEWVRDALEYKYYANTPQLLNKCSPSLKEFASYVYEQDQDADLAKEVQNPLAGKIELGGVYEYTGPSGVINYQDSEDNNLTYNYSAGDKVRVVHKYNDRAQVSFGGYKDPNKKKRIEISVPYDQLVIPTNKSTNNTPVSGTTTIGVGDFAQFNIGDKLKYLGTGKGEYTGQTAEVVGFSQGGQNIDLKFPDGYVYQGAYAKSLQLVSKATPAPVTPTNAAQTTKRPSASDFKLGEKVTIISTPPSSNSNYIGMKAMVVKRFPKTNKIKVKLDYNGQLLTWFAKRFQSLDNPPKDTPMATTAMDTSALGYLGTATITNSGGYYPGAKMFKGVVLPKFKAQAEPQNGDKVKVLYQSVDGEKPVYGVENSKGEQFWIGVASVKLDPPISTNTPTKLVLDDMVSCVLQAEGLTVGKQYKVEDITNTQGVQSNVRVTNDTGKGKWYPIEAFKKDTQPQVQPNNDFYFTSTASGHNLLLHYWQTDNGYNYESYDLGYMQFIIQNSVTHLNNKEGIIYSYPNPKEITPQEAFNLTNGEMGKKGTPTVDGGKSPKFQKGDQVKVTAGASSLSKKLNGKSVEIDYSGSGSTLYGVWYSIKGYSESDGVVWEKELSPVTGGGDNHKQDFFCVHTSPNGTQWFQHYKYDPKGDVWSMHSAGFDADHNNVQSPTEDWKVMGASQGKTYEDLKAMALKNNYKEISGALFNKVFSSKEYVDPSSDPYSPDATTATTPTDKSKAPSVKGIQVGDSLECINNRDGKKALTVGKAYKVAKVGKGWSYVENDKGKVQSYKNSLFKKVDSNQAEREDLLGALVGTTIGSNNIDIYFTSSAGNPPGEGYVVHYWQENGKLHYSAWSEENKQFVVQDNTSDVKDIETMKENWEKFQEITPADAHSLTDGALGIDSKSSQFKVGDHLYVASKVNWPPLLQEKPTTGEFKVGDVVKIKSGSSHYANQVGTITGLGKDSVGELATIKLDTQVGQVHLYTHIIEPLVGGQEKPSTGNPIDLKNNGANVLWVKPFGGNFNNYYVQNGKIHYNLFNPKTGKSVGQGEFRVDGFNGTTLQDVADYWEQSGDSYKIYSPEEVNELLGNKVLDPEQGSPEGLKVEDTVEYLGQDPIYQGKHGIIIKKELGQSNVFFAGIDKEEWIPDYELKLTSGSDTPVNPTPEETVEPEYDENHTYSNGLVPHETMVEILKGKFKGKQGRVQGVTEDPSGGVVVSVQFEPDGPEHVFNLSIVKKLD